MLRALILALLASLGGCSTEPEEPANEPSADARREICERLDECVSRRQTIDVDECVAALAKDDDALVEACAECFRAIEDRCPPDDICEERCPRHGF